MAVGFAQWGNDLHTGRRSYDIVGQRRKFYIASIILVVLSLVVLLTRGFNLGIDFRGGTEFTVSSVSDTGQQAATDAVASVVPAEQPRVSSIGSSAVRVQTTILTDDEKDAVRDALAEAYDTTNDEITVSSVGPTWGADVSKKALTGLVVFLVLVTLVMSAYFRAWRMALAALIALFHDLIITAGIYAMIGWEVTPATVIGFLTILGYSIYDTVVVFDKVRENTAGITEQYRSTYGERANLAVNQTLVRSINTAVVALLPVASILFIGAFVLGAGTLRDIALALFIGMAVGTYSSIFLATPLEVTLRYSEPSIKEHTQKVLKRRAEALEAAKGDPEGAAAMLLETTAPLVPGAHQGHAAQPRRRKK